MLVQRNLGYNKGEVSLRAGESFLALIFLFLDRFSSFFDMLVQMCASFRYRSLKTQFLLLPPEILPPESLPPSLIWRFFTPYSTPSQYGCLETHLFQHIHMLVVSRINSILLNSSLLNSLLLSLFVLASLGSF